jgi:hypothetical protein
MRYACFHGNLGAANATDSARYSFGTTVYTARLFIVFLKIPSFVTMHTNQRTCTPPSIP